MDNPSKSMSNSSSSLSRNQQNTLPSLGSDHSLRQQSQRLLESLDKETRKRWYQFKEKSPNLSSSEEVIFLKVFSIHQDHVLNALSDQDIHELSAKLLAVDLFYNHSGGLQGYHNLSVDTIRKAKSSMNITVPDYENLTQLDQASKEQLLEKGFMSLNDCVLCCVVGGSADRLHTSSTGNLPTALLPFHGKTLIEHFILDILSLEKLYESIYRVSIDIPIVLMTSNMHENDVHIKNYLKNNNYFGKNKDRFAILTQPLVPIFDQSARWVTDENGKLILRPGGHGMLWQLLAQNPYVDSWLHQGKQYALVRQINNPILTFGQTVPLFLGSCVTKKAPFGIMVVPKKDRVQEGVIAKVTSNSETMVSNIEYCQAEQSQVRDLALPANTNFLFADLNHVPSALKKVPFPGPLVNWKMIQGLNQLTARLELSMQNLSESFTSSAFTELPHVVLAERSQVIASIKKRYQNQPEDTVEYAYYTYALQTDVLLRNVCFANLPSFPNSFRDYHQTKTYKCYLHPFMRITNAKLKNSFKALTLGTMSTLYFDVPDGLLHSSKVENSLKVFGPTSSKGCFILKSHFAHLPSHTIDSAKCNQRGVSIRLEKGSFCLLDHVVIQGAFSLHLKENECAVVLMQQENIEVHRFFDSKTFSSTLFSRLSAFAQNILETKLGIEQ